MTRYKSALAIVLVLLSAGNSFAKNTRQPGSSSSPAQIDKECRQALVDAAKWEAEATLLGKQVEELKAQVDAGKAEAQKLRDAIAKHEAAIAAQDKADARVAELRANHAAQMANVEKQLALEQQKARFNVSIGRAAAVVAFIVGGALGFILGSK